MHSQSNEDFRRKSGRLFKRRIAAFSAAIMAAICALVMEAVLNQRNAALEQAWGEAANLSAGLEEQVRGTLNGVADFGSELNLAKTAGLSRKCCSRVFILVPFAG